MSTLTKEEKIINDYQRKTWRTYKQAIGLPENYTYLYGNPVKVHVPVDTAINGVMIIGAYPTAHFNVIGSQKDVPVSDHLYPFSTENYFDGSRINGIKSGEEIEKYFLGKKVLDIKRADCWITDLVKVFLFKEGHVKKYTALGYPGHTETRSKFNDYAKASKYFIDEEIQIAQPKVILGLGTEVNAVMLDTTGAKAQKHMADAVQVGYPHNGKVYPYFPVPHPGILMREVKATGTWNKALNKAIKNIRDIYSAT